MTVPAGSMLTDLLHILQLGNRPVAIECNRAIVPRANHATTEIQANDSLEIVTFVGGG